MGLRLPDRRLLPVRFLMAIICATAVLGAPTPVVAADTGVPPVVGPISLTADVLVQGRVFVASADFVASGTGLRCTVEFGNGTGAAHSTITGSTCVGPHYMYPAAGTFTITVTVTDGYGLSGTAQSTVSVGSVAPVLFNLQVLGAATTDAVTTAHADFVHPGTGIESYSCSVDFGDGTGAQPGLVLDADCTADHTYTENGLYTVTFTVVVSNGATASGSIQQAITDFAPTVGPLTVTGDMSEGGTIYATAAYSDPWSTRGNALCEVDWGDGTYTDDLAADFQCPTSQHMYLRVGQYTLAVSVFRGDGVGRSSSAITVSNAAPVVAADSIVTSGYSGVEYASTVSFSDPGLGSDETYVCAIDYGDGATHEGIIAGNTCTDPNHSYVSKGTYHLVARVTDSNGAVGTYSASVVMHNEWPIVGLVSAPAVTGVGASVTATAAYTSTGLDPADTCTVDYGDGGGSQSAAADGVTCFGPSHAYQTAGTYTIRVTVTSALGSAASSSSQIVVGLLVGTATLSGSPTEGSPVIASAVFAPFGKQSYTCKVDYGDGSGFLTGTISGAACKGPTHKYGRPGAFSVTVKVTGSKGSSGASTATATIANVPPSITSVTVPATAKVGTSVTLSVAFADPGTDESFAVTVDWGDGNRQPVRLCPGARSFTVSHSYQTARVYSMVVEVSDDGGASVKSAAESVAVYDPARSATGSGSFASPAGACSLSSKCAGSSTATFSLSAAYGKGATKPSGSFTFSASGITFQATSLDWYLVQGGVGALTGTGKVNGVSGYHFTLSAVDGSPDKILLSIADSNGNHVYANTDYAPLTKGSITLK